MRIARRKEKLQTSVKNKKEGRARAEMGFCGATICSGYESRNGGRGRKKGKSGRRVAEGANSQVKGGTGGEKIHQKRRESA